MSGKACKRCGRRDLELIDSILCAPCEREEHERPWTERYLDDQADALIAEAAR